MGGYVAILLEGVVSRCFNGRGRKDALGMKKYVGKPLEVVI
jgi:hypothetical protein